MGAIWDAWTVTLKDMLQQLAQSKLGKGRQQDTRGGGGDAHDGANDENGGGDKQPGMGMMPVLSPEEQVATTCQTVVIVVAVAEGVRYGFVDESKQYILTLRQLRLGKMKR